MSSGRSWPLQEPLGRLAQLTRSAFGHHASGGGGEEEKKMPPVRQVPTFQKAPPHLVANIPPRRRPPPARSGPTTGHGCNPFTRSVTRQVPEIGRPPQNPARNASYRPGVRRACRPLSPARDLLLTSRAARMPEKSSDGGTVHLADPAPSAVPSPTCRRRLSTRAYVDPLPWRGRNSRRRAARAWAIALPHPCVQPKRTSRTDSQQRTADRQVGSRTYVAQASLIQNQPLQVKGTRNFIWYLTRFQI
jgi:hypothetical protein